MKVAWNMVRHVIRQGEPMDFVLKSHLIVYSMFAFALGLLIIYYENFITSDLVTVKRPLLLETLEDVLDADNDVNVSFVESSNAAGIFMRSPVGTVERKLYQRSVEQWKGADDQNNYQSLPTDKMLESPRLMIQYNLALLSPNFPSLILLGVSCSRADTDPDMYSNFYRSKDSFMFENQVQIARVGIDGELEKRLRKSFTRVMETGFHDLQVTKGHEMTLNFIPLPEGAPKLLCLNVKSWSEENDEHTEILELRHCVRTFINISMLYTIVLIVLIIEKISHKYF